MGESPIYIEKLLTGSLGVAGPDSDPGGELEADGKLATSPSPFLEGIAMVAIRAAGDVSALFFLAKASPRGTPMVVRLVAAGPNVRGVDLAWPPDEGPRAVVAAPHSPAGLKAGFTNLTPA